MAEKKRKRGKNWSSQETVLLIEAKHWIRSQEGMHSASEKWQAISDHLEEQNVLRDVEQCRSKWENMIGDFKSIIEFQKRELGSYFTLTKEQRKEFKLPGKFPEEIFVLLSSGRTELESPSPLALLPPAATATTTTIPTMVALPSCKTNGELVDVVQFRESGSSKRMHQREVEDGELSRTVLEAHEKLMEFLRDREAKRSELEERRLSFEKERMEAEKEDRLKIYDALNSMAVSWRKISEQMLHNSP